VAERLRLAFQQAGLFSDDGMDLRSEVVSMIPSDAALEATRRFWSQWTEASEAAWALRTGRRKTLPPSAALPSTRGRIKGPLSPPLMSYLSKYSEFLFEERQKPRTKLQGSESASDRALQRAAKHFGYRPNKDGEFPAFAKALERARHCYPGWAQLVARHGLEVRIVEQ
jgi:hypothetical protein